MVHSWYRAVDISSSGRDKRKLILNYNRSLQLTYKISEFAQLINVGEELTGEVKTGISIALAAPRHVFCWLRCLPCSGSFCQSPTLSSIHCSFRFLSSILMLSVLLLPRCVGGGFLAGHCKSKLLGLATGFTAMWGVVGGCSLLPGWWTQAV